jgi:N-acetylglutamate synthase-like GNAT family acetyltransferase
MIRQATINDIDNIKRVADCYKKELGFILRPALVEAVNRGELLYHESGAFCHWHRRRDQVSVIYEICVPDEARGQGLGRAMVEQLPRPIRLKCPVTNASNEFYQHLGLETANGPAADGQPGNGRDAAGGVADSHWHCASVQAVSRLRLRAVQV